MISSAEIRARISEIAGMLERAYKGEDRIDLLTLGRRVEGLSRCIADRPAEERPVFRPALQAIAAAMTAITAAAA